VNFMNYEGWEWGKIAAEFQLDTGGRSATVW